MSSYDPGEQLRVTLDANGALRVHHGAREVATIKSVLGGAVKVQTDDREWRLTQTANGWFAEGDPTATLSHGLLGTRLRIGPDDYRVRRRAVKGLLKLAVDRSGHKPQIKGEILGAPRADGHATVALATAALVLDADLSMSRAHSDINGDNRSAALRYGHPGV